SRKRRGVRWWLAVGLAALVAAAASYAGKAAWDTKQALVAYGGQQRAVEASLQNARSQGFTNEDLRPILERRDSITGTSAPSWPLDRASFYEHQSAQLAQLRQDLKTHLPQVVAGVKGTVTQQAAGLQTLLRQNQEEGGDVGPLQSRLDTVTKALPPAGTIRQVRELQGQLQQLSTDVNTQSAQLKQERDLIQPAAAALLAQNQDVDALRAQGTSALSAARDDATVAAYEAKAGRFKPVDTLMAAVSRLEFYSTKLQAPDREGTAFAAAAEQRYGKQIHDQLVQNLGPQHVIVSFQSQRASFYENGRQVQSTLVTTGPRGDTAFGTDFGPMRVLRKAHPWKMHSPWPQGSPYWYPDTVVQWTVFFTNSGEAFHDANWQPDSTLGPGSQYTEGTRSHGCIHMPWSGNDLAQWLYNWAQVGTPVDVVPGSGQPVADQLGLMTTDDHGNPLHPA
ncbi:MAG: L,D-transpeptidase family protein, partial [Candidatus Dormibacteraeota bacterium]|nr:L,D-transpeptidase family protein [Candidatus Dormibacteraeota bacterium]MBO0761508.1 L,D-transpeptidase family protein [Candidatus Dormibacteraeota bacterium]